MADHLARIFGTEEDKVNCPFYYKIGACRHGDRCSRNHMRPTFSSTILVPHFYMPPGAPVPGQEGAAGEGARAPDVGGDQRADGGRGGGDGGRGRDGDKRGGGRDGEEVPGSRPRVDDSETFEDFFLEVIDELKKYGELEHVVVVENLGDHMFGNVYVKYGDEDHAARALQAINGRYYAGRTLTCEFSPVTDFREARCRQFDEGNCSRGGYCNFMHLRQVPRHLQREIKEAAREWRKRYRSRSRSRSRDRGRKDDRRRSRSRDRGRRDDRPGAGGRRSRSRDRGDGRRDNGPPPPQGGAKRSDSEERRARIAEWNRLKEEQDKRDQ